MDINKLDYFFAAAELNNFTQAADKCNIAQTTMSKYIVSLEEEIGLQLFHRTNKGCSLTVQGELFYTGMKKVYAEYSDVIRLIQSDEKAEIKIGVDGEFFKIQSLKEFEDAHRSITLSLTFASRDRLFEDLRKHRIHAVIIPDVVMSDEFLDESTVCVDLRSEEGLLTYSTSTKERFASIGEMIEAMPLITKSADPSYHEYCRKVLFKHYGTEFKDVQVVDTGPRQQLLVSLSQGFAIIPESELASGMDLQQESVSDEFMETLQLVYSRKFVSSYLKEFIRFIKTQI
ncbi:MAG: LysR family transcriptional regulator [Mogibacterium sp.]|nr:LysR family transcriptional regulator [Mogibacterium sp.]